MHPVWFVLILAAALVIGWLLIKWGEKDKKKMVQQWEEVEDKIKKFEQNNNT